jgi:hypothetical protein
MFVFADRCRLTVAAASCIVLVVLPVSAFAQSDNQPWYTHTSAAVSHMADAVALHVVRKYESANPTSSNFDLPPNVVIPAKFQATVTSMVRGSPTFRRQCLRLASAPRLTVVLQSFWPRETERLRGRTVLSTTPDGGLHAVVEISPLVDHVELIGHEIEHIIEQLDGVDLRALSALPTTGVHSCECDRGAFETIRAIRVGRAVAEEVRRSGG